MKIVHLFSIYLFSSTPYPITGYLIFKDNSLFLRSTILLSIISIEVKRGEGKRDATSWNFNQRTIRKKKKKRTVEEEVVLVFNLRFESSMFIGIPFRI